MNEEKSPLPAAEPQEALDHAYIRIESVLIIQVNIIGLQTL